MSDFQHSLLITVSFTPLQVSCDLIDKLFTGTKHLINHVDINLTFHVLGSRKVNTVFVLTVILCSCLQWGIVF